MTDRLSARTMLDLKVKLREAMGWPDRRSWTPRERIAAMDEWLIMTDNDRNLYVATRRGIRRTKE